MKVTVRYKGRNRVVTFRKGERVRFWGRQLRFGRIVSFATLWAYIRNDGEIWQVPYQAIKKVV